MPNSNETGRTAMRTRATTMPKSRIGYALVVLGALLSLGLTGCAEQEGQTFYIAFSLALEDDCEISAGGGQVALRPRGRMDLVLTNEYYLFANVVNSMSTTSQVTGGTPATLQLENNNLQIIGGKVSYSVGDIGIDLPQNQFVFTSGTVRPGNQSPIQVHAIPPLVGEFLRQAPALQKRYSSVEVVVKLTLEGTLQDGTVVKSREFVYPIDVCRGCLIQYNVAPEFCCDPATWGDVPVPCFMGQDLSVDCRTCCASTFDSKDKEACLP